MRGRAGPARWGRGARGRWRAWPLVAAALVSRGAAAQPDWLPDEVAADRRRSAAAAAAEAAGDPCADPLLGSLGPPLRDSGFDRAQDACLAASFGAGARYLDGPGDRGGLAADLAVRWLYLADLELALGARAIADRVTDEDGEDDDAVFGPVYASAAAGRVTRAFGRPLRLAWGLRVDLPWTESGVDGPVVAAVPQGSAALQLRPGLVGRARLAALLWLALPADRVETRRAAVLSADLAARPWRWLVAGAGVEVQTGWYGAGLDHLAVRAGLRLPLGGSARIELSGAAPLAGDEPLDVVGQLALTIDR